MCHPRDQHWHFVWSRRVTSFTRGQGAKDARSSAAFFCDRIQILLIRIYKFWRCKSAGQQGEGRARSLKSSRFEQPFTLESELLPGYWYPVGRNQDKGSLFKLTRFRSIWAERRALPLESSRPRSCV